MASSSSSSASSSSSSSASASSTSVPSKSNQTIGLAVGLGVGIPILLTIIVLAWVTVRHRRKIREEDEIDKDIDFNGDVSFWSPHDADVVKFGAYNTSIGGNGGPPARRDTMTTSHTTNGDQESMANLSEVDALSTSDHGNTNYSQMYTPELGFTHGSQENFTRAIHNVYGPSPAYPSTEKLKAPSIVGSTRSGAPADYRHSHSNSFSSGVGGPFATPPRHANSFGNSTHPYASHFRRGSDDSFAGAVEYDHRLKNGGAAEAYAVPDDQSSIQSAGASGEHDAQIPRAPHLNGLREAPHPYSNLAGTESAHSIHTARSQLVDPLENGADDSVNDSNSDPASPLRGGKEAKHPGMHIYHQQAKSRHSELDFDA